MYFINIIDIKTGNKNSIFIVKPAVNAGFYYSLKDCHIYIIIVSDVIIAIALALYIKK